MGEDDDCSVCMGEDGDCSVSERMMTAVWEAEPIQLEMGVT